jgi:nucleoid-associated protein YgaU
MRKDLKAGIIFGTILSAIALLLISVFSSNVEERRRLQNTTGAVENTSRGVTNLQSTTSMSPVEPQKDLQPRKIKSATRRDSADDNVYSLSPAPKILIHTVAEGETLTSISIEYYGSASMWQGILNANRDIVKDENRLRPGMKLVIPKE